MSRISATSRFADGEAAYLRRALADDMLITLLRRHMRFRARPSGASVIRLMPPIFAAAMRRRRRMRARQYSLSARLSC